MTGRVRGRNPALTGSRPPSDTLCCTPAKGRAAMDTSHWWDGTRS
jgi:hypothetical protein